MSDIDNNDTILATRLESTETFKELFNKYYAPLVVFACRYVYDIDISREIVQDFFVRFYEKRHTITVGTSLKSYLYRSIYNSCINYINQKNIQDRHLKNIGLEKDYEDTLESEINTVELQQKIYEIIEDLPSKCKKIFKMNRFEGIKNEEIARELNLSKRTVETQISKALKILRHKLDHYAPGYLKVIILFLAFSMY